MRASSLLLLSLFASCAPVAVNGPDAGEFPDAGITIDAGADAGEVLPVDPCDSVTCGDTELCIDGLCAPRACNGVLCATTQLCFDGGCLEAACVGVTCAPDSRCVDGSCEDTTCDGVPCATDEVCSDGACVNAACLGVTCDGGPCVSGVCTSPACGGCAADELCVDGQCAPAACVGVTCATGFTCDGGACVMGCTATQTTETSCTNGVDDDCDGLADCADSDCAGRACADDAKACTRDVCQGGVCAHPMQDAGVICRASMGGCDVAEACTGASTTCPADVFGTACTCAFHGPIAGYSEFDGLRAFDAGTFVLRDTNTWSTYAATFDALALPRVGLDVLPLNRAATVMPAQSWPGWGNGFQWAQGDLDVTYWIPQGLAGGTAGSRSYVAVAWYYEGTGDPSPPDDGSDKGFRVAFADVTSFAAGVNYRHVLFVEPDATRGFKPVNIHAGGLAWSGSYLYVADTNRGLRVFDLSRLSEVSTSAACSTYAGTHGGEVCAYGYQYVVPQVGGYYFPSGLGASCKPTFSYVALDRSTSPDSLLSGEYDNDTTYGLYSRVFRWPLGSGSRLATNAQGIVTATGGWYTGARNIQGAIASGPKFFLNATRYSGALLTGPAGSASTVLKASDGDWAWMPEGMYISAAGNLWSSTEGHTSLPRAVFYVHAAQVP